jgi:hypothetical protein
MSDYKYFDHSYHIYPGPGPEEISVLTHADLSFFSTLCSKNKVQLDQNGLKKYLDSLEIKYPDSIILSFNRECIAENMFSGDYENFTIEPNIAGTKINPLSNANYLALKNLDPGLSLEFLKI